MSQSPYTGIPLSADSDRNAESIDTPTAEPPAGNRSQGLGNLIWLWGTIFLIMLVVAHFYSSLVPPAAFTWTNNLEEGLALAQAEDRLVLVAFKTAGCPACVQMDREVLSQEPVGRALSTWVAVNVNPNRESRLAARYNIQAVPTYIILTPGGAMLDSAVGFMDVTSFVGWIDRTESRWRARKATASAVAN